MKDTTIPTPLTFGEKMTVGAWRNLLMPLLETIGGKKFPAGRVTEHAYGNLPGEKLDFIPPQSPSRQKIAIVHIHGGGWITGSKGRFYSKPLLKFSDAGYPVFSLNYPLAPEHPHPQILRSLLKALVWIKRNHSQFNEIHLIGDSAGGNLAMMLAIFLSNPKLLEQLDTAADAQQMPKIKTVLPIYGVMDRISLIEDGFPSAKLFVRSYAGAKAVEKNFVSPVPVTPMDVPAFEHLPPVFIVGAGNDKLLRSSKIYAERLQKDNRNVEFKIYEGTDHGFFSFGKGSDELHHDILNFFSKQN